MKQFAADARLAIRVWQQLQQPNLSFVGIELLIYVGKVGSLLHT